MKNQKGFAILPILLLLTLVGAIGGVGWYVYSQNKEIRQELPAAVVETDTTKEVEPQVDLTVTELSEADKVVLIRPEDINKLPAVTPQSFKDYMKGVLVANKPVDGCYEKYTVTKISAVNISGSVNAAGANGEPSDNCVGGAAMFWYVQNNQWNKYGTQSIDTCDHLATTKIYVEFIDICLASTNSDATVPNPNGSIKNAKVN